MPMTAGSISIARRINTGDYSHKEAKVELHYTAEGGEDIKVLGAQAAHAALVQLAQVLATIVKIDHTPEVQVEAPEVEPDVTDESEAGRNAPKRRRRTKPELEANQTGDTNNSVSSLFEHLNEAAPPLAASTEKAVEITDKELNNKCNETMFRIKDKVRIQAVIGEYTQGAVSTIPQALRTEFMEKLKDLS